MHDAMELFDYWREYPPVHVLMRGYVGYKPQSKEDQITPEQFQRMINPKARGGRKLQDAPARDQKMFEKLKAAQRGG